MARMAKVKNSAEIIRTMEESKSPWHHAQEYVNIKLTERKYRKREGKTAQIFAAFWLANNYRSLLLQTISLKQDLEIAKSKISSPSTLRVSMTNTNASHQQPTIQGLNAADSKCEKLSASSSTVQTVQSTHTIDCNATSFSISSCNRKVPPSGVGDNANSSLKDGSSFERTSISHTAKSVNQVVAIESSQPKTTPVVKRRVNALQKIKCFSCGLFGHISQFCLSSGEKILKPNKYTTKRRDVEVYSPRWGEKPKKYENTNSYIPSSTIKAQNEALQYEIRQMKQERDEFVKEFQSFKRNIIDLNLRNGGSKFRRVVLDV